MQKISEFMIDDHKYLDQILFQFLNEKDFNESQKIFQKFKLHLEKHFRMEDEILFPLFYKHLGIEKDTKFIIKRNDEHKVIFKLLDMLVYFLNTKNNEQFISTGDHFKNFFSKHQERENTIEYSLYNNFISVSNEDWQKMVKSIYGISVKEVEELRKFKSIIF